MESYQIPKIEVRTKKEQGMLIHHQQENWDDERGEYLTDEYWAADPEFVSNYFSNGGTWGYRD